MSMSHARPPVVATRIKDGSVGEGRMQVIVFSRDMISSANPNNGSVISCAFGSGSSASEGKIHFRSSPVKAPMRRISFPSMRVHERDRTGEVGMLKRGIDPPMIELLFDFVFQIMTFPERSPEATNLPEGEIERPQQAS